MIRIGTFFLILGVLLAIAAYMALVPPERTLALINDEIAQQTHLLGLPATHAGITSANQVYQQLSTDPSGPGYKSIAGLRAGMYLVVFRASMLARWWQFAAALLAAALLDAIAVRKIRYTAFSLTSPQIQGMATRLLVLLPSALAFLLVLPVSEPAWLWPSLMPALAMLAWAALVHFAKRG
jgi:hypothetical protein